MAAADLLYMTRIVRVGAACDQYFPWIYYDKPLSHTQYMLVRSVARLVRTDLTLALSRNSSPETDRLIVFGLSSICI